MMLSGEPSKTGMREWPTLVMSLRISAAGGSTSRTTGAPGPKTKRSRSERRGATNAADMPENAKTMKNSATWIAARYSIARRPIVPARRPRRPRSASSSMSCGRRIVCNAASLAERMASTATRKRSNRSTQVGVRPHRHLVLERRAFERRVFDATALADGGVAQDRVRADARARADLCLAFEDRPAVDHDIGGDAHVRVDLARLRVAECHARE